MSCKVSPFGDQTVAALIRSVELGEVEVVAPVEITIMASVVTADRRAVDLMARHAYRAPEQVFGDWSRRIWHHALARGVAMRLLAEGSAARAWVDPMLAYSAGLLADVGAPYLLRWWAEGTFGGPVLGPDALDRIAASVRLHHEAAGAALLSRWGLDPFTVHLARNHHVERPCYENPYWVLAIIAEIIACSVAADPDLTYGAPLSAEVREACCNAARLSAGELRRLIVQTTVEFQALRALLDAPANDLIAPIARRQ